MLVAALILNVAVLVPIVGLLIAESPAMDKVYGPATQGRAILACIYGAICAISAALIAAHLLGLQWAVPMTVGLFAVQITYKLATAPAVGLGNPVVLSNLAIVAFQVAALATLVWR